MGLLKVKKEVRTQKTLPTFLQKEQNRLLEIATNSNVNQELFPCFHTPSHGYQDLHPANLVGNGVDGEAPMGGASTAPAAASFLEDVEWLVAVSDRGSGGGLNEERRF